MKNIGILEFHFHIKFLHTMMRICKTNKTSVTVFTTKKILSRIETYIDDISNYEIILKKEDETVNQFLKRVEKICNDKIDLLFINTIQTSLIDVPHYFTFKPKCKKILTVHMVNHWFKARFGFNIKNMFRSLDATLSIYLIRYKILPNTNGINVIYLPMKDFILKNTKFKKPIFTLPFNFYDEKTITTIKKTDGKLRIVLPGLIEEYRRDYNLAINIFEKIFDKYKNKIIIDFLGMPIGQTGKNIIEKCKKLKNKGYNIIFSEGFVPEEEYNQRLIQSDIIFSPLRVVNKRDTGITETYGLTEGSALPFEAIQYTKPLIIPKDFKIIDELKTSTLTYKTQKDLEEIFSELITNKEILNKLKIKAKNNSNYFKLDVLQDYLEKEILEKLDEI